MKVIIAGTRTANNYPALRKAAQGWIPEGAVILSGCAAGADALGERYAAEQGYQVERYPANWGRYGKAAGPIRNAAMAGAADRALVIWDGRSKGTKNLLSLLKKNRVPVRVIPA